jgi:hypothetical protein
LIPGCEESSIVSETAGWSIHVCFGNIHNHIKIIDYKKAQSITNFEIVIGLSSPK